MLGVLLLAGCGPSGSGRIDDLTWQEAKAEAQKAESRIAALLPADEILSTDQRPTGTLFSCDATHHQWMGMTTVVVSPSTDVDSLIRAIGSRFNSSEEFEVSESQDVNNHLRVQLVASDGENYLVSRGRSEGEIEISSGSRCFRLPDDVYPRGDF